MDVCYLINQLAPGGAPTLLLNIVRRTDDTDIEFTVCFIEGDDTLVEDFHAAGARVVSFDAAFKFDPRALLRLARFFQRESFDIVHAHLPYAQSLGRVGVLFGDHTAVVSTQHNFPSHYHPVTRITERATRPLDDVTLAVSEAVESAFTGEPAHPPEHSGQWRTVYNGADTAHIDTNIADANGAAVRERHDVPPDANFILTVGRYIPEKRQSDLIRAFASMDATPDTHLVLVGWGPLEDDLRATAREHGVEDRVAITGRVVPPWPYYAAADTFALASEVESFGIVLVEAMAAGLPIVATDILGAREVLDRATNGVERVPSNAPTELASALARVVNDPVSVAYDDALEKFDIERSVVAHHMLYRELAESGAETP